MSDSTSPSLLLRVGRQEDGAWGEFVQLYTPLLFHWALKSNLQRHDAVELVQEVFLALVTLLPTFKYDPQRSFRAWLFTIMRTKWADLGRKQARQPRNDAGLSAVTREAEIVELVEREFRDFLVQRALEIVVRDFGDQTIEAFRATALHDRSVREVAAELGMTEDAVYLARSRVMKRLREQLAGMWDRE